MRDLDDVPKSQPAQVIDHPCGVDPGNDDRDRRRKQFFQRRSVEMIPMQMGQVDVIRLQIGNEIGRRLREIPPAAPIAGADQPRVGNDANAIVFNANAGMA